MTVTRDAHRQALASRGNQDRDGEEVVSPRGDDLAVACELAAGAVARETPPAQLSPNPEAGATALRRG